MDAAFTPSYERYSAVFLFFVLHSLKFWQLYIYRAWELLQDGGYLVLGFRDDNFCYWLHGVFTDSIASCIKDAMHGYWARRCALGIRNYDQMFNVISPVLSIRVAEDLGFVTEDTIRVSNVREYQVLRNHFCWTGEEPAYWNIARVGVSVQDAQALAGSFAPQAVDDTLNETMVVFIMKK